MTSAKRGHRCHIWTGCRHAADPAKRWDICDDPDSYSAKEDWWAKEVIRLFSEHTSSWPETSKRRLRRLLEDAVVMNGVHYQERIDFQDM